MLKLKIDLNYKQPEPKNEKEKAEFVSSSELTSSYINYAANKKYPNGLKGVNLRAFARIQNKLDTAILDKIDYIELESAEVDFLKEILKGEDVEFPANVSKFVVVLLDEFDNTLAKEKEQV